MFSFLVGVNEGVVPAGRLLEYTEDHLKVTLGSDLSALQNLPALSMPEVGDGTAEQVAQVGRISHLRAAGRNHTFTFTANPNVEPIPSTIIQDLASRLNVTSWEFSRTHFAVKDVDLFEVLLEHHSESIAGRTQASGAVKFPVNTPRDPSLVAVMMPFSPTFDSIYETIESAVGDVGLTCARADDIWIHDHVMDDVLSLLWRSQIVVADLTGRNTNVFYETGLAHALSRPTVLLTQEPNDVPFDLRAIRYLKYGVGTRDRAMLRQQLGERLRTLTNTR